MLNKTKPYHPIDCSFYDRLEEAITLKNSVTIEITDENGIREISTRLVDLFIENEIEWLRTVSNEKIRLDHIHSLNGIVLEQAC